VLGRVLATAVARDRFARLRRFMLMQPPQARSMLVKASSPSLRRQRLRRKARRHVQTGAPGLTVNRGPNVNRVASNRHAAIARSVRRAHARNAVMSSLVKSARVAILRATPVPHGIIDRRVKHRHSQSTRMANALNAAHIVAMTVARASALKTTFQPSYVAPCDRAVELEI
jgi:hypothetical protein